MKNEFFFKYFQMVRMPEKNASRISIREFLQITIKVRKYEKMAEKDAFSLFFVIYLFPQRWSKLIEISQVEW